MKRPEEAAMKQQFSASLGREGDWVVAQCLEVDVASQGESESAALANLQEALALHFEEPVATAAPHIATIEVEVGAT
jgi:predicted RNase H-like HicB family nuclease